MKEQPTVAPHGLPIPDPVVVTEISGEPPEGQIVLQRLTNGLTVVLMRDTTVPIVAVDIWYKVGSKDEEPGKSGFAHLFEHMMFQGSENVGKAEHMKLISDVGGWMNGSTNKDRTNYFEVVPANQLRLALWLEADRMRALAINAENFENQRDTVKEERRQRVDNRPYGPIFSELLDELVYENWAYKHSVIGSMADLDNATLEDVRKFHDVYYRPNNAVLAIVGDFKLQDAMGMVEEYFGPIPAGPTPPAVDLSEPPQQQEKRMQWEDKFAPHPAFVCAFKIPPRGTPEYYPLEVIEKVLFDGESSRMYQRLVEKDGLVLHLFGGVDARLGPGLFLIFAQVKPGHTIQEVEAAFWDELDRIKQEPLDARELQKVKNKLKAEHFSRMERAYYKADLLCMYTAFFEQPELFYTELDRYLAVTAADIQQAARTFFNKNQQNVIEVYPANQPQTTL